MRIAQSILQRMARVRGRGYAGILLRARSFFVNQGGTADCNDSSLTESDSVKDVFCAHEQSQKTAKIGCMLACKTVVDDL